MKLALNAENSLVSYQTTPLGLIDGGIGKALVQDAHIRNTRM